MFTRKVKVPLHFTLTRFAGKFGPPMAEWTLGRIVEHERKFALSRGDQVNRTWAASRLVTEYRYLSDLTLVVLGVGDIGLCIARAAKAFGMRVLGYARNARDVDELDKCVTDLNVALQEADYLVSVLPSTEQTRGMLAGDAFAATVPGGKRPVFLNLGRGDIIDEESLVNALEKGFISAAILDVFSVEPLPTQSPLWGRPDVTISPHVSGITRADDVPDLFLEQYNLFMQGKPLRFQVDWDKGY